jgi:hypothetical protein
MRRYLLAAVSLVHLLVTFGWRVDVEVHGGYTEVAKEGMVSAIALFVVRAVPGPPAMARQCAPADGDAHGNAAGMGCCIHCSTLLDTRCLECAGCVRRQRGLARRGRRHSRPVGPGRGAVVARRFACQSRCRLAARVIGVVVVIAGVGRGLGELPLGQLGRCGGVTYDTQAVHRGGGHYETTVQCQLWPAPRQSCVSGACACDSTCGGGGGRASKRRAGCCAACTGACSKAM